MSIIQRHRSDSSAWFLALIFILLAGILTWAGLSLRMDRFTEVVKEGRLLTILFVIDDGALPLASEVLFYDPGTHKGALFAVPGGTGALLTAVDRMDRLESLYNPYDLSAYQKALDQLLGRSLDFAIRIGPEQVAKFVDHLEGIELFIPSPVDETAGGRRFLFPSGSVVFGGAKALDYLSYTPEGEPYEERTEREHRFFQALLRGLGEKKSRLTSLEVLPWIEELLDTDLDRRALVSLLEEVGTLDTERMVLQGIVGTWRNVDGKDILFPYYNGKLIGETLGRIEETLAKAEAGGEGGLTVNLEILNGTKSNGLASRTAQIYRSYGFRIASIKNADRSDYERTVVLDRQGNPDLAAKVAELIKCRRVYTKIDANRDETIDVTVILGKDFYGRYVKE